MVVGCLHTTDTYSTVLYVSDHISILNKDGDSEACEDTVQDRP
jgi:hypothetical protein